MDILRRRPVVGVLVLATLLPLIDLWLCAAPPWPDHVMVVLLTMLLPVGVYLVASPWLRRRSARWQRFFMPGVLAGDTVLLVTYALLSYQLVYALPDRWHRDVGSWAYTEQAQNYREQNPGISNKDLVSAAGSKVELIFTQESLGLARLSLLACWFVLAAGGSLALAALLVLGRSTPSGMHARPELRATETTSSATFVDQAFSSHTVLTCYPAPIALPYRRFYQDSDARAQLHSLYAVLEASIRYLLTLALADLLHCLAETGRDTSTVLAHSAFDFLRKPKPMLLGHWLEALRESARALAMEKGRVIAELPVLCKPGGRFEAGLLGALVARRNAFTHPDGSIRVSAAQCQQEVPEFRPRLEEALREMQLVRHYPLGFLSPLADLKADDGQSYYQLHGCMGAWIGGTSRVRDLQTSATLPTELPFIVTPDGTRLLFLWPWLLERRSDYTGRRTLGVFEEIPRQRGNYLTAIRAAAIDVPESWSVELHPEPASNHAWLLDRLRQLPAAPQVPVELHLADWLSPTRGGRLLGQMLGSNRLLSLVAVGGYATVYAAEDSAGRRVAVKVIESRTSATELTRFTYEFDKLRQAADHLGIIRCYEQGNVYLDGRLCPWYSMEFAPGGDLRSRIEERRTLLKGQPAWQEPATRAAVIEEFRAIAEAVAHLHRLHIVHRDLKPGNVLIAEDGTLRLSDFGLVKNLQPSEETLRYGPKTSVGGGAGTAGYMAPEQARGEDVNKTADVYALGILLAELALGKRPEAVLPFGGTPAGSTLRTCKPLKDLPPALRALIERCTDVVPERRPVDAEAVLREFTQVVG